MSYLKWRGKYCLFTLTIFLSFNLYFIFLMPDNDTAYLEYLDFLLLILSLLFFNIDYHTYRITERAKKHFMPQDVLIAHELPDFENKDIAEHDIWVMNKQLQQTFDENCELQDYVAKWCHELKIPLAASLLIMERTKESEAYKSLREQLEKMKQQIASLLLGCKLQSALFDIQIKRIPLQECVKTSIRNNSFFLIQKNFTMDIKTEPLYVYSDPSWLVYVLDQILNNAVKYAGDNPSLKIWTNQTDTSIQLFIKDYGEGIKSGEIRQIFEKGFTGSNFHNGKYKSTGMGLYMVSKIMARLGHSITAESEYGSYTQFCITFLKHT